MMVVVIKKQPLPYSVVLDMQHAHMISSIISAITKDVGLWQFDNSTGCNTFVT
jgi:hypothetical protein